MSSLSISAAWEQTKAIIAHDGRLLTIVALALIALPATLNDLVNPTGVNLATSPPWMVAVAVITFLVSLAGQLSLIRLALGPSITVGGAIAHGFRRSPVYLAAIFLIALVVLITLVVVSIALVALGVRLDREASLQMSTATVLAVILFAALFLSLFVRMVLTAPIVSAEHVGPVGIIRRSWQLTSGRFWPLLGFLLAFFLSAGIAVFAVSSALGVIIRLTFGKIEPMSTGALLVALVGGLLSAIVTVLFALMIARIYLELSGRHDAQVGVPNSGI